MIVYQKTRILRQIKPDAWYPVHEIVGHGWLPNTVGKNDRAYIYQLINRNLLMTRDFGINRKLLRVRGASIIGLIKKMYD